MERERGSFYGLPMEARETIEDWETMRGHLEAIRKSGEPVAIYAGGKGTAGNHAIYVVGYLGKSFADTEPSREEASIYPVYWPEVNTEVGGAYTYLTLPYPRFKGGRLSTDDGDDYFRLTLDFEAFTIQIGDMNAGPW